MRDDARTPADRSGRRRFVQRNAANARAVTKTKGQPLAVRQRCEPWKQRAIGFARDLIGPPSFRAQHEPGGHHDRRVSHQVSGVRTVDEFLANLRWPFRVFGMTFAIFALIALLLSAMCLYAIMAYTVTQRTQEIGIRMELGARRPDVWRLIARRAMIQLGAGLAIGLAAAVGVGKLLQSTLV